MKKRYGKLVRDRIPEIIRANKEIPNTRVMGSEEFHRELLYKLVEEAEDLIRAGDDLEEIKKGIATVIEIVNTVAAEHKLAGDEIEQVRQKRFAERGGFGGKIFLESVE